MPLCAARNSGCAADVPGLTSEHLRAGVFAIAARACAAIAAQLNQLLKNQQKPAGREPAGFDQGILFTKMSSRFSLDPFCIGASWPARAHSH
jgi:hypothetical protein